MLQAPDTRARNEVIAAHLPRMEAQLALTQSVVASLRSLLEWPPPPVAVEHRSVALAYGLGIREQVPAPGLDAWWESAFRELDAALVAASVRPAGPRAALYPAEFFELGTGEVVAYVPVAAPLAGIGRAAMFQIPAAELAVAVYAGTLADVDQTYGALGIYVAEREIGIDGPIREQYLVTPFDTEDESDLVTEVCWPLVRAVTADPA